MSNVKTRNNGIGCLTVIGLIFLTLKLLAVQPVADWSWWLVLAPFWIQVLAVVLVLSGIGFAVLFSFIGNKR